MDIVDRSIFARARARSLGRFPTLITTVGRICTRLGKNLRQEYRPFGIGDHKHVISIGLRFFFLGFKQCRCGDGDDDDDDGVCFFLHDPHTLQQQLGSRVIDFALLLLPQHYASRDVRIIRMHLLQLLLLQLHACAVARAPLDFQASRFLLQSAIKGKNKFTIITTQTKKIKFFVTAMSGIQHENWSCKDKELTDPST
jgi:hypothetical protein